MGGSVAGPVASAFVGDSNCVGIQSELIGSLIMGVRSDSSLKFGLRCTSFPTGIGSENKIIILVWN